MTRKRNSEDLLANSGAAAVPARRKAAPRTRAKHAVVPADASAVAPETETAAPQPISAEPTYQPTHEEIAALAFTYWAGRGYQGGSPEEDWLRAETELRSRLCSAATA